MKNNIVRWGIMIGLWAVLLVPFFVAHSMYFPYISGKNFAFRIIVEIIFALWIYLACIDVKYRPKFSWLAISILAFVILMGLADFLAVNPLKAIWSNYERMDGFVTLIHLLMYFLVFGSVMRSKENWLWFYRSSVLTSMGMIIFVIQEWTKTGAGRVSVTLGNPIYVAVYFMFNFFFVLILLYQDVIVKSEGAQKQVKNIFTNWLTYIYAIAAAICFFGIWRTSTRGVIFGLLGGLIFTSIIIAVFEKTDKFIKNLSISTLVAIFIVIVGFFAIKDTQFVKNNYTLQRFASLSWTDVAGQGQGRRYVWPMALKGFQERPLFGWGQDGFNNVFNKYYDERMYNQEQWFDRAHNTPLDVLIAGGALSLIAYLSIFVASIYVITRKKNNFGVTETGLIVGLLAAYFAQNLFVFDNLVSYFYFYALLAYIYSRDSNDESIDKREITDDTLNYVVLPIVLVLFGSMLWYANIKPINANKNLILAMQTLYQSPQTSLDYFKKVFEANTFGNSEAREQLVSIAATVSNAPNLDEKLKQEYVELAFSQMNEQLKESPDDARYQFFMGVFLNNINQYQAALPYLQKALELSPKKLTMMFELAKSYAYLGQKEKALELAKTAYELVPQYDEGKMNYAAALILNDQESLAKEIMGTATTSNPIIARMFLIKASGLVQMGYINSAVREVQKAIDMVPQFKPQGEAVIKGILDGSIR